MEKRISTPGTPRTPRVPITINLGSKNMADENFQAESPENSLLPIGNNSSTVEREFNPNINHENDQKIDPKASVPVLERIFCNSVIFLAIQSTLVPLSRKSSRKSGKIFQTKNRRYFLQNDNLGAIDLPCQPPGMKLHTPITLYIPFGNKTSEQNFEQNTIQDRVQTAIPIMHKNVIKNNSEKNLSPSPKETQSPTQKLKVLTGTNPFTNFQVENNLTEPNKPEVLITKGFPKRKRNLFFSQSNGSHISNSSIFSQQENEIKNLQKSPRKLSRNIQKYLCRKKSTGELKISTWFEKKPINVFQFEQNENENIRKVYEKPRTSVSVKNINRYNKNSGKINVIEEKIISIKNHNNYYKNNFALDTNHTKPKENNILLSKLVIEPKNLSTDLKQRNKKYKNLSVKNNFLTRRTSQNIGFIQPNEYENPKIKERLDRINKDIKKLKHVKTAQIWPDILKNST